MATDLSSITTAANALSNLILVSPQKVVGYQPQNPLNPDGTPNNNAYANPALLFHYEGEQTAHLKSDITDHYIEDNTAIQDQWALHPVTITTHGFIGDLNNVPPNQVIAFIQQQLVTRLTTISAYTPALSVSALNAYNQALFIYQTAVKLKQAAVSAWNGLSSGNASVINGVSLAKQQNQTPQQTYFQLFYGFWTSRALFTVQTPWAVFQNMAIDTLRAIQEADTNVITDFEVTFKQIRFANTLVLGGQAPVLDSYGRAATQSGSLVDLGVGSTGPDTAFQVTT